MTYTYSALNDTPDNPDDTVTPMSSSRGISDDLCSPVTPRAGTRIPTASSTTARPGPSRARGRSPAASHEPRLAQRLEQQGRAAMAETMAESTVTVNGPDMTLAKSSRATSSRARRVRSTRSRPATAATSRAPAPSASPTRCRPASRPPPVRHRLELRPADAHVYAQRRTRGRGGLSGDRLTVNVAGKHPETW